MILLVINKFIILLILSNLEPSPESSMSQYKQKDQKGLYANYLSTNEAFLSRGHYTPSGDFNTMAARQLTFINTNIAPQWQENNGGNWCKFEESLTIYTNGLKSGTKKLYIFTGTGMIQNLKKDFLSFNLVLTINKFRSSLMILTL